MNTNNILVAENLSYVYEDNNLEAVKNVSLAVSRGSYVAILGLNGSGKSTLLNIIGGLESSTRGDIFVGPYEISKLKEKYGKNAILKGMNLEEGGTAIERNGQVGGHRG